MKSIVWIGSLLTLGILSSAPARADVVSPMTPDRIQDAIDYGRAAFGRPDAFSEFRWPGFASVWISTPYHRVAAAAALARLEERDFDIFSVTPEMLRPVVIIRSPPYLAAGDRSVHVERIVMITPPDIQGWRQIIEPDKTEKVETELRGPHGETLHGRGLIAEFPLKFLKAGYAIRITRSSGSDLQVDIRAEDLARIH
ncbi:MAG: hypothetical protein MUF51_08020 [Vicinamibacteria bacterium]|jgi:hypothetical protein|nr:hypothetical protein [Vicinamibacteria bacterium]